MLPFGLTTDVSAAALAAGAGGMAAGGFGLQGSGQVAGQAAGAAAGAKGAGFAVELKAAAGADAGQAAGAGAAAVDPSGKPAAAPLWLQIGAGALDVASDAAAPMPEGLALQGGETANAVKPAGPSVPGDEPSEPEDAQPETPADAGLTAFAEVSVAAAPPVAASMGAEAGATFAPAPGAAPQEGSVPSNSLPAGAAGPGPLAGAAAGTAPLLPRAGASGDAGARPAANGGLGAGAAAQVADAEASGELPSPVDALGQVPAGKDRRWQSELPQELRAQTYVPARAAAVPGLLPNGNNLPAAASGRAANVIAAVAPGSGEAGPAGVLPQQPLQAAVTKPAAPGQAAGPAAVLAAQPVLPNASAQPGAPAPDTKTGSKAAAGAAAGIAAPGTVAGAAAQAAAAQASAETAVQVRSAAQGQADTLSAPLQPEDQLAAGAGDAAGEAPLAAALKADAVRTGQSALQRIGVDNTDPAQAPAARPVGLAAAAPAAMARSDLPDEETDFTLIRLEPGAAGEIGSATVRGGDLSGAVRTESLQTPNQTQSAHVSGQVAAEIARNLKNGQTRFQMRFDPPELGRVEVHMKVKSDGSVQTHLIVDRPETLDMFLRDQRGLERALENAGLTPDSANMQFSLKQDGNRDFASGQDGAGCAAAEQGGSGAGGAEDSDPMAEDIVRLTLARQRGGLDMKV